MPFLEFVKKYDLANAKLVGEDAIFISASEYWKLANRAAESVIRRSDERATSMAGFLAAIEGYNLCLSNEIAGTGITVSEYPAIDLALLLADVPHADQVNRAFVNAVSRMRRNLNGYVVRSYDINSDMTEWVFGDLRWPKLLMANHLPFPDDPLGERTEDVPLAEFLVYQRDWYHPRYKTMREAQ